MAASALAASASAFDATKNNGLVTYWGQGANQQRLVETCKTGNFDVVNIGFVTVFPDQSPDGWPGTNFGNACYGDVYEHDGVNSTLLKTCPYIAQDVQDCQTKYNTKIFLSLGGGYPNNYYITDDASGEDFADFLWGAFGPVSANNGQPRPWGNVAVDGFDFDIESEISPAPTDVVGDYRSSGYAAMINHFKNDLYPQDSSKQYYISGSPQCVIPDAHFTTVMAEASFDFLWIQFYNTPQCSARAGVNNLNGQGSNDITFSGWENSPSKNPNIKLYLGLPADEAAANDDSYYLSLSEAQQLLAEFATDAKFGGVMLWEATYDMNNTICDSPYSYWIQKILNAVTQGQTIDTDVKNNCPSPTTSSAVATPTPTKLTISPNGACGGDTFYTCEGSKWGQCCSVYGYCGSTDDYCGKNCDSDFGLCGEAAAISRSSSSSVVSTTSSSSSSASPSTTSSSSSSASPSTTSSSSSSASPSTTPSSSVSSTPSSSVAATSSSLSSSSSSSSMSTSSSSVMTTSSSATVSSSSTTSQAPTDVSSASANSSTSSGIPTGSSSTSASISATASNSANGTSTSAMSTASSSQVVSAPSLSANMTTTSAASTGMPVGTGSTSSSISATASNSANGTSTSAMGTASSSQVVSAPSLSANLTTTSTVSSGMPVGTGSASSPISATASNSANGTSVGPVGTGSSSQAVSATSLSANQTTTPPTSMSETSYTTFTSLCTEGNSTVIHTHSAPITGGLNGTSTGNGPSATAPGSVSATASQAPSVSGNNTMTSMPAGTGSPISGTSYTTFTTTCVTNGSTAVHTHSQAITSGQSATETPSASSQVSGGLSISSMPSGSAGSPAASSSNGMGFNATRTSGHLGGPSASNSGSVPGTVTVTDVTSIYTTTCPATSEYTSGGSTLTSTYTTVSTLTSTFESTITIPASQTEASSAAPASQTQGGVTVTDITSVYTTTCPASSEYTSGGSTLTSTYTTVSTLTSTFESTITIPASQTGAPSAAPASQTPSGVAGASKATSSPIETTLTEVTSVYTTICPVTETQVSGSSTLTSVYTTTSAVTTTLSSTVTLYTSTNVPAASQSSPVAVATGSASSDQPAETTVTEISSVYTSVYPATSMVTTGGSTSASIYTTTSTLTSVYSSTITLSASQSAGVDVPVQGQDNGAMTSANGNGEMQPQTTVSAAYSPDAETKTIYTTKVWTTTECPGGCEKPTGPATTKTLTNSSPVATYVTSQGQGQPSVTTIYVTSTKSQAVYTTELATSSECPGGCDSPTGAITTHILTSTVPTSTTTTVVVLETLTPSSSVVAPVYGQGSSAGNGGEATWTAPSGESSTSGAAGYGKGTWDNASGATAGPYASAGPSAAYQSAPAAYAPASSDEASPVQPASSDSTGSSSGNGQGSQSGEKWSPADYSPSSAGSSIAKPVAGQSTMPAGMSMPSSVGGASPAGPGQNTESIDVTSTLVQTLTVAPYAQTSAVGAQSTGGARMPPYPVAGGIGNNGTLSGTASAPSASAPSASASKTAPGSSYSPVSPYTGGAATNSMSFGALVLAAVVAAMML
ncbi:glycoside hydrolase [Hortaea werneckii]|nr:glycoside hydrolase [Hortaea werneckii]KAI7672406.1 glycoside hydrolase [Hortaea werneckii]KAI7698845.1 glycoside hydrolase [Hortaea werneckii]